MDFLPPRQRAFVAARMGVGGKLARGAQACKFGLACRRSDCWFSHPEDYAVVSEGTGGDVGSGAGEEGGGEGVREEGDGWGELPLEHRRSGVVELLLHGRFPYTMSVCVYVCSCMCVCVYVRQYQHTHTHKHTYTRTNE